MRELIDSLLNFSRLGRGEVRYEPIDLREYIESCLRNLQAEIRTRNAHIKLQRAESNSASRPDAVEDRPDEPFVQRDQVRSRRSGTGNHRFCLSQAGSYAGSRSVTMASAFRPKTSNEFSCRSSDCTRIRVFPGLVLGCLQSVKLLN